MSYDAFAPRIFGCSRRTVSMLWLKTSGRSASNVPQRLFLDAEEVGRQHLDGDARQLPLQRPDRRRVVAGPTVGHVVAVDGCGTTMCSRPIWAAVWAETERLERVGRRLGLPRVHVAVAARTGTRVTEDLKGRLCRGPSTRRCSGSEPPRRSCAGSRRGSACARRSSASSSSARAPSSTRGGAAVRLQEGSAPRLDSIRPASEDRALGDVDGGDQQVQDHARPRAREGDQRRGQVDDGPGGSSARSRRRPVDRSRPAADAVRAPRRTRRCRRRSP